MSANAYDENLRVEPVSKYDFIPKVSIDSDYRTEENKKKYEIIDTQKKCALSKCLTDSQPILYRINFDKKECGKEIILRFNVNQGNSEAKDRDGTIEAKGKGVEILSKTTLEAKYGWKILLKISTENIAKDACIEFYSKDTGGFLDRQGEVTDEILCGMLGFGYKLDSGFYYNYEGYYLGKVGDSENVYVCSEDLNGSKTFNDAIPIMIHDQHIQNDGFLRIAGTAYGESGLSLEIIKRIPFVIGNRHIGGKKEKINDTLIHMRNNWSDEVYAHKFHHGAQGNGAFREFLDIKLNEKIDYEKNSSGRNLNAYMRSAIQYTIKAIPYYNGKGTDISYGAIGWHGLDIKTHEFWKKCLYFHSEHKKNGFENWMNEYDTRERHHYETVANFKGERFGTTVLWKLIK